MPFLAALAAGGSYHTDSYALGWILPPLQGYETLYSNSDIGLAHGLVRGLGVCGWMLVFGERKFLDAVAEGSRLMSSRRAARVWLPRVCFSAICTSSFSIPSSEVPWSGISKGAGSVRSPSRATAPAHRRLFPPWSPCIPTLQISFRSDQRTSRSSSTIRICACIVLSLPGRSVASRAAASQPATGL